MSDQPPEGVVVVDNEDGTQTVHASAVLHATVATEPDEGDA